MRFTSILDDNFNKLAILISLSIIFFFLFRLVNISNSSYFSQDDFFHLRMIMDKNIYDIPSFFVNTIEGQTFYRPLSRETYNLIMYQLFGLNPMPFHIYNLLLILLNSILLTLIVKRITNSLLTTYLSVLIFLVSSIHSVELYYLSSVQTLMSTSLVLLSILVYTLFIRSRNINYFLFSILLFSIALFSHESSIVLPGFILILEIFYGRKISIKSFAVYLMPFLFLALLFLISTTSITNLPSQKVYQPIFNIKSILNTFGWYLAWSLGVPEMLVDFVKPGLKLKPEFVVWYKDYVKVISPLIFIYGTVLLLLIFHLRKTLIKNRFFIFCVLAFIISLLPFIFFPQHKFVYYLSLAFIWFSIIFGIILSSAWQYSLIHKALVVLAVLAFSLVAYKTIEINSITHWAAKRAKSAEVLMEGIKKDYPSVPKGSIFYIKDDPNYPYIAAEWGTSSKQVFYILSGSDALKLFYKDSSIETYFQAVGGLPKKTNESRVINFTAIFPY